MTNLKLMNVKNLPWLTFLLLIFLTGFQLSCSPAHLDSPDQITPDRLELNVLTFNIRYGTANDGENRWDNRRDMVFDVLQNHAPDLVGLQEALRFQLDQIAAALPEFAEVGVGRDDGRTAGEYAAILFRRDRFALLDSGTFWLSDTPEITASKHWGNSITRICTWARLIDKQTAHSFYFFNTHFDHRSQPSRLQSAALITQRILAREHPDPFVLTGDFNAAEDNPAIQYLKGSTDLTGNPHGNLTPLPLIDTFRARHPNAEHVGTAGGFEVRDPPRGAKIDYIFTATDHRILQADIIHDQKNNRYPSDHRPVTAQIQLIYPQL